MNLWNYDLVKSFNKNYFTGLLTTAHLDGFLKQIRNAVDDNNESIEINQRVYPLRKGKDRFFLPESHYEDLPLVVKDKLAISIKNEVYWLVTEREKKELAPVKMFKDNKLFIEKFCDYEHSNKEQFFLMKILAMASYLYRINVRVSSNPGFGKDSVFNILESLKGDIGSVSNPTIAKIEYMLINKVLITNEVSDLPSDDIRKLQQYYLLCGDFSNQYTKRSRALISGSNEEYDISRLSNLVFYNNLSDYPGYDKNNPKSTKYFDNVFSKAVKERFIPFKFEGKIQEQFDEILNPDKIVNDNIEFYKGMVKHLNYMITEKDNLVQDYGMPFKDKFNDRWLRNWRTIMNTLSLFVEDETEFNSYAKLLYERHKDYLNQFKIDNSGDLTSYNEIMM